MSSNRSRKPRRSRKTMSKKFVNAVKKVVRNEAETKYTDLFSSDTNFTTARSEKIADGVPIPQGTGTDERIGNQVMLKGLTLGLRLEWLRNVALQTRFCRYMVVHFRDFAAAGSGSFNAAMSNGTFQDNSLLPRSVDRTYKVLLDKKISLNEISGNSVSHKLINSYVPINKLTQYSGPLSTDLEKGGIVVYLFTGNSTANVLTYDFKCRIHYKDI